MKRRYTIERASTPGARRRFLARRAGDLVWASAEHDDVRVWHSPAAALWFQSYRMGLARADAVIVEHSVH